MSVTESKPEAAILECAVERPEAIAGVEQRSNCSGDCHCGHAHDPGASEAHGDEGHEADAPVDDGEPPVDDGDESWRGDAAPSVDEPAPEEIEDLAAACVRFVHDAIKVELDFTPETLPLLDYYLSVARDEIKEKLELRELVFRAAGAYFGEVMRRRLNGYWLMPTADTHSWRVCGRHVLLAINPVGVIAEAVAQSEESEGPSGALRLARLDQEDVARRLAEAPPLPEDEFFLTSTRLEVIDVVVEHLRVRMEQNDQADMEFDRDDYAHDLQPYGRA
jgi:hypothetical protein